MDQKGGLEQGGWNKARVKHGGVNTVGVEQGGVKRCDGTRRGQARREWNTYFY